MGKRRRDMRFLAFLFIAVTVAVGLGSVLLQLNRRRWETDFIKQYLKKFKDLGESYQREMDAELYEWLTRHVLRVERIIAEETSRGPYAQHFRDDRGRGPRLIEEVLEQMGHYPVPEQRLAAVKNYMTRCLGVIQEGIDELEAKIRNPAALFREGMRAWLLLPAIVWSWARGSSELDPLHATDGPRMRRWSARLAVVGLVLPLFILFFGVGSFLSLFGLMKNGAETVLAEGLRMLESLN
jgi:hypothetical protein